MVTIKNAAQIKSMRKAGAVVRDVLALLEENVREGISTKELDTIAAGYLEKCGAAASFLGYNGYPATICASIDEEVLHGIPSQKRILKNGQIISIDFGAIVEGYHGDAARTFAVGAISPLKQKLIDVTRESFFKGIEIIKPDSRLGEVSRVIQNYVESNGFSVVRAFTGHGIGSKMHEEPNIPNYVTPLSGRGMRLVPGMALAIEPMVCEGTFEVEILSDGWTVKTKDRKMSAHYENTVLITENGYELLTY